MQVAEVHKEICYGGIRVLCWDDFKKPQITWWIEKMCAAEMFFKIVTAAIRHHTNRYARCVGCNKCSRFAVFFHVFKNLLLDVKAFYNHLNYPIASVNMFHVIAEASC